MLRNSFNIFFGIKVRCFAAIGIADSLFFQKPLHAFPERYNQILGGFFFSPSRNFYVLSAFVMPVFYKILNPFILLLP
jgi:hypothetical protein